MLPIYALIQPFGLIRFDYFPLWALAGLMTERFHDILTAQAPVTRWRPARP